MTCRSEAQSTCEWKWISTNAGALHGGYYKTQCGRVDPFNNPHSPCIYCGRPVARD